MGSKFTRTETVYTVQVAQYDRGNGELIPYAKPFGTLEEAAKYIVKDYNILCKGNGDPNTLSRTAWKGLAESKYLESPGGDVWPVWIKWTIQKQTVEIPEVTHDIWDKTNKCKDDKEREAVADEVWESITLGEKIRMLAIWERSAAIANQLLKK